MVRLDRRPIELPYLGRLHWHSTSGSSVISTDYPPPRRLNLPMSSAAGSKQFASAAAPFAS